MGGPFGPAAQPATRFDGFPSQSAGTTSRGLWSAKVPPSRNTSPVIRSPRCFRKRLNRRGERFPRQHNGHPGGELALVQLQRGGSPECSPIAGQAHHLTGYRDTEPRHVAAQGVCQPGQEGPGLRIVGEAVLGTGAGVGPGPWR